MAFALRDGHLPFLVEMFRNRIFFLSPEVLSFCGLRPLLWFSFSGRKRSIIVRHPFIRDRISETIDSSLFWKQLVKFSQQLLYKRVNSSMIFIYLGTQNEIADCFLKFQHEQFLRILNHWKKILSDLLFKRCHPE